MTPRKIEVEIGANARGVKRIVTEIASAARTGSMVTIA